MLIELDGVRPTIAADVYIAPTAVIIGDVTIGAGSSIWFGAVIRGDTGPITIGRRVSVQDNAVIHVNRWDPTVLEDDVLIGHAAVLEGCLLEEGAFIGMHATILTGARVGRHALVAAHSLIRERQVVAARVMVAGVPAVFKADLSDDHVRRLAYGPQHYVENGARYRAGARILSE
jgi:carbonic anhydrase/acetyltransferase-like protein (isoleucine patch superfamily)